VILDFDSLGLPSIEMRVNDSWSYRDTRDMKRRL
jgi:hypothetical protein